MGKMSQAFVISGKTKEQAVVEQLSFSSVDHITHIDNLGDILRHGLLSHNNPYQKVDISNRSVNARRDRIEPIYHRNLHDYVPLYFNPRNAMLYRNQIDFGRDVVILGFRKNLILSDNVVFTNGNAACNRTWYSSNIVKDLPDLNWSTVWSNHWYPDDEVRRIMMAEVLVYEKIEMKELKVIFCQTKSMKKFIENNYRLKGVEVKHSAGEFFEKLI